MIAIKQPPVIDVSHYIPVPDFAALDPLPWMIITKATEGTGYLDATYADYADRIREAGIRLGAYHFMRPGDETRQADWFCEILLTVGLTGNEVLACDVEVDAISLDEIRAFLDRVQDRTGIRPMVYSTELRLEALYPHGVCPVWLKAEWLWIAEYPLNPDPIDYIPSWVVPSGCSLERVGLWQYTDDGIIAGIPGNNVDLNLIGETFMQAIQLTEPNTGANNMTEKYYKLNTEGANIRTGPGSNNLDKGDLVRNDVIQAAGPDSGSWRPFKLAQHSDGSWVVLADHVTQLSTTNTVTYWATNAYFVEVANFPSPLPPPDPEPDPDNDLPNIEVTVTLADADGLYVPQVITTVMIPRVP